MDQQEEQFQKTNDVAASKYVKKLIHLLLVLKNKMYLLFELCDLC
jgi:hypothetical protein